MRKRNVDILVIGAGPAGLAAAIEARKAGVDDILVVERDEHLGGILQQCIHPGFGLHLFGEELTGPEYVDRFVTEFKALRIPVALDSMAIEFRRSREVFVVGPRLGQTRIVPKAVVLAMGCRERTRAAIGLDGTRPAGIFTAGTAQRLLNIEGVMPGKEIVIVGSGDVGLIMARRLTLEGARVKAVVEMMPYPGGITRNVVQCLDDFGIPLYLSHVVTEVGGRERVESVTAVEVDGRGRPVPGTRKEFACDTLLISAGLIPENELSRMAGVRLDPVTMGPVIDQRMATSIPGVFACGDVAYVHNLVDWVTIEARRAGRAAAEFVTGRSRRRDRAIPVCAGRGVRIVVPQRITLKNGAADGSLAIRPVEIVRGAVIRVRDQDGALLLQAKKRIVKPAEIFDINLDDADLSNAKEIRVTIGKERGRR